MATPRIPSVPKSERLLLRGTHRHEEYAGLGNALPDSLHRRDMEMIKAMGANFVRLAHYPQDPEIYRACDELGIKRRLEIEAIFHDNAARLIDGILARKAKRFQASVP